MANEFTIKFPKEQVNSILAQMKRAEKELGKSVKQSTAWAGWNVCDTMAGATEKSKTTRPIVKNPDPRAGTDRRIGLFGVMKYVKRGNGKQYFDPIYKGGEFGQAIKYLEKGSVLLKVGTKWEKFTNAELRNSGVNDIQMQKHPKRKIGMSGLAKKAWHWCKSHTLRGGIGNVMGMPNIAKIRWTGADKSTLEMSSNLRYAMDALKSKGSEINYIMAKAADSMSKKISMELDKQAKAIAK